MADNERRACGQPADDVVELVLGTLDGQRRAAVLAHLLQCPACRRDADDLAATVADLLPAIPTVPPPVGFEAAVLDRLAGGGTDRRRRRLPGWLAVAAAVLLLVAVGAGVLIGRAVDSPSSAGETGTRQAVTLRRPSDGIAVGTVALGEVDGRPLMTVAIVDAPEDVSYTCRLRLGDGRAVDTAAWPPVGTGAWVVELPAGIDTGDVEAVELVVTGTDHVWSSAVI